MKNPYMDLPPELAPELAHDRIPDRLFDENTTDAASDGPAVPNNLDALCRDLVCPSCPVRAEAEDTRLRSLAEMENFKRRLQREHEDRDKYMGEAILSGMLPALDSLDLAIQYGGGEAPSSLLQGVTMTRKLLLDALRPHGLIPIGEPGEPFDHESHEAVGQEERSDMEPMHVAALLQRGYRLKDRLLRPAKVLVSCNPA